MKRKLALVACAAITVGAAQAANWSDTYLGYRYAPNMSEPGVTDKVAKNIFSMTHVSGDRLGMNLFTIDLLKSGTEDPSNNGTVGAQEWYGFYKRSFSLNALMDKKDFGTVKDINLTLRFDAGSKNTTFAPAPFKLRPGVSFAMPVSAGFWDIGADLYKEWNYNGIVGTNVAFKTAIALSSAWAVPAGPGTFGGFLDIVGPKGKDGFNDDTKTEVLLRGTYMVDVGGPKSGLKAGVGAEFWSNKFGCNNGGSLVKNSCRAVTPLLLVEYHM